MQQQMTHSTLARHHCLFLSRRNQMSPCSHVQQGFPTLAGLRTKVWADTEAPDSWSVGGTKHESLLARRGLRPRGLSQLCTNWAYQGHGPISIYQNGLHYKRVVRPEGQKESSRSLQPTRKLPNPSLAATQVLEERRLLWSI